MPSSDEQRAQLEAGIAALEAQRATLGNEMVEAMLGPAREKLAALESRSQSQQQRKQATVLFADVSGFTAMSETMDAEVVAGVMNELWAEVDRAVTDHEGRIDKHIGDEVMALWGADTAREDDPERAVRAALAMQAAVARFCETRGMTLAMRVGINTGPVVLGAMGTTAEFTAMGDAVNVASRLEHAAPVGGILIGHDTYSQVRGIFDVLPQDPLSIKGKAEPVRTYVVQRAKPRAFRMATRGVEGVETRMIGRDADLETLKNTYLDVMESAETRMAGVVGVAGVGKSRLLYEFENWIEMRPEMIWYFKGRATSNAQNVAYSLFRDLFANRFEILESDPIATALDKFRRGMAGALEPDSADIVGYWLGFDFSGSEAVQGLLGDSGLMQSARAFLMRYFRALTADSPTVIFLEDVHWADDSSLDLAVYLATALPEARLLLVAVTRSRLFERRPNWDEGRTVFRRISLMPLPKRSSRALVDEILKRVDEVPDSLRNLITDAAEGNPFYVEEMVKMLIEQGIIERGGAVGTGSGDDSLSPAPLLPGSPAAEEKWRVRADKLATLKVPPTLTALLQARLDGLPRLEREALQRASVVGRLFWDDAVADLLEVEREAVTPALEAARGRELIFRRERSAFAGTNEYIFKHVLLRDVAYETVLLNRRAAYHGRAARWLETHAGERLSEYLTLIAEHYIQAGVGLRAAALLVRAGDEAMQVGAYLVARTTLERALALREAAGERDGPAVDAALISIGRASRTLGDYAAAKAALERGLVGARSSGNRAREAEALGRLAHNARVQGDYSHALALAEEALRLGRPLGGRLLLILLDTAAQVLSAMGDLDGAESRAMEALTASRTDGDLAGERIILITLGAVAAERHELERSKEYYLLSLEAARRTNHLYGEGTALLSLGELAYQLGDYATARTYGRQAEERVREMDMPVHIMNAFGNVAQAELKLGDVAAARRGASEALQLARSLGALPDVLWAVFLHGQIMAEAGEKARGLLLFGLARAHPALEYQVMREINEEIARQGLPPEEVEAGLAAGAALDLETVVGEILEGKW